MPKTKVILSLGCNLGDRRLSLTRAVEGLKDSLDGVKVSSVFETSPVVFSTHRYQPLYYNLVLSGFTSMSPHDLLIFTQGLESIANEQAVAQGFPVYEKHDKGPRYLDIDIVFFGDMVIRTQNISIPHPSYRDRLFVLLPLLEIESEWRDPVDGIKISKEMAEKTGRSFPDQRWANLGSL